MSFSSYELRTYKLKTIFIFLTIHQSSLHNPMNHLGRKQDWE